MAGTSSASGLLKSNGELLPLRSVSIAADIKGYVLGLRATMKYLNDGQDPVEVLFKLPLESKQAIVGLTAHIDGNKIRADIQEKEQAKANYDDAIASGLTAAYGETKTDDIFSVALGNLPGGEEAEIELQMVEELPIDAEGKVRFSLPTTFKPRYTPQGTVNPLAPAQTEDDTAVEHGRMSGFQEFLLKVYNAQSIEEVTSSTHTIHVGLGESDIFNVTLENNVDNVTSDLVIQISHKSPHKPAVIIETGMIQKEGEKPLFLNHPAVMVNFFPEIPHIDVSCELIFLVDRSGSMSGGFIKSAAETLVLFLKSMPEGSYFNIFGFGSSFEKLFPTSVIYSQDTLATATAHAQSLTANLGGTEVLPPLKEIFRQPEIKGITRQIFLLTDGAVSNTTSCIDEVRSNSHKARCFTFGIGAGASTALVNGIAEAGNGTAEFVKMGERLQPKVIRSLKHALQPAVTDVKVTFSTPSNVNVTTSPQALPPLFSGDKTVIYGIIEVNDKSLMGGDVTLSGSLLGEEITHKISFEIPQTTQEVTDDVLPVHRLAAKRLLEDMQTENKSASDIVKLSIDAQVISNKTAFIAINEGTTKPVSGPMKTYDIETTMDVDALMHNVAAVQSTMMTNIDCAISRGERLDSLQDQSDMLSAQSNMFSKSAYRLKSGGGFLSGVTSTISGWFRGGVGSSAYESTPKTRDGSKNITEIDDMMEQCNSSMSHEISDNLYGCDDSEEECNSLVDECLDECLDVNDMDENMMKELTEYDCLVPSAPKPAIVPKPTVVSNSSSDNIILLQQANGSWELNESFSAAVSISLSIIESSCPSESDKMVWATILAVVVLKVKYPSQHDEWDLIVGKAKSWLRKKLSETQLDDLMKMAEKIL